MFNISLAPWESCLGNTEGMDIKDPFYNKSKCGSSSSFNGRALNLASVGFYSPTIEIECYTNWLQLRSGGTILLGLQICIDRERKGKKCVTAHQCDTSTKCFFIHTKYTTRHFIVLFTKGGGGHSQLQCQILYIFPISNSNLCYLVFVCCCFCLHHFSDNGCINQTQKHAHNKVPTRS